MLDTLPQLKKISFPTVSRVKLKTLQVNLGYLCNQQCLHCHVNAGPKRTEVMTEEVVEQIIQYLQNNDVKVIDLTGGAPEMNPYFKKLVVESKKAGVHVIDRCNLTVLLEPNQQDLAQFLADNKVELMCSLPCYIEENVDSQRGKGVYQDSIKALRLLNEVGYGSADSELELNMVYNPLGASLPPSQQELEHDYKKYLKKLGLSFNKLYTITNMPIKRFGSMLLSQGKFEEYITLLQQSYQQQNLDSVMCRSMVSIDWQGNLYDCDFNQMLNLPIEDDKKNTLHIGTLTEECLIKSEIQVAGHCFGCTAGQGSSCGGALE
jgi:radical SAM/Cys-rich protein